MADAEVPIGADGTVSVEIDSAAAKAISQIVKNPFPGYGGYAVPVMPAPPVGGGTGLAPVPAEKPAKVLPAKGK